LAPLTALSPKSWLELTRRLPRLASPASAAHPCCFPLYDNLSHVAALSVIACGRLLLKPGRGLFVVERKARSALRGGASPAQRLGPQPPLVPLIRHYGLQLCVIEATLAHASVGQRWRAKVTGGEQKGQYERLVQRSWRVCVALLSRCVACPHGGLLEGTSRMSTVNVRALRFVPPLHRRHPLLACPNCQPTLQTIYLGAGTGQPHRRERPHSDQEACRHGCLRRRRKEPGGRTLLPSSPAGRGEAGCTCIT
jgi:hypothetical protein